MHMKRKEFHKEIVSKTKLISFVDLIDHVQRVKLMSNETFKTEAAKQLQKLVETIFYEANY